MYSRFGPILRLIFESIFRAILVASLYYIFPEKLYLTRSNRDDFLRINYSKLLSFQLHILFNNLDNQSQVMTIKNSSIS